MRALGLVLLLAACAAPVPDVPSPVSIPLRNPTAAVGSQTDATLTRLHGDWIVVEGAGLPVGARLSFAAGALRLDGTSLPAADLGRGRLRIGAETIWVHWLDADNRTAALGEPGGGRVWIMDRSGRPGERLKAARDILDWYGYDMARLGRP